MKLLLIRRERLLMMVSPILSNHNKVWASIDGDSLLTEKGIAARDRTRQFMK